VIGILGLVDKPLLPQRITNGDLLFIIGKTEDELGGSEYYEYIHGLTGGHCPVVDFKISKSNMDAVLKVIKNDLAKNVHDCSKGGLAIAISELCIANDIGCKILLEKIPNKKLESDRLLFSETHSRYMLVAEKRNKTKIQSILGKNHIIFEQIGEFEGDQIIFNKNSENIINLRVDKVQKKWMSTLEDLVHG